MGGSGEWRRFDASGRVLGLCMAARGGNPTVRGIGTLGRYIASGRSWAARREAGSKVDLWIHGFSGGQFGELRKRGAPLF